LFTFDVALASLCRLLLLLATHTQLSWHARVLVCVFLELMQGYNLLQLKGEGPVLASCA